MILKELIEITSPNTDFVIFVNTNPIESDNPTSYFDGQTYRAVKNEAFYPNGIDFEDDFNTLEVERITIDTYEKYSDTVSVLEIYVV